MSVGILLKLGSYNSSRCTYFILHCAYLVRASLNSLYIHLSVLPEVEMSVAGEWAPLSCKHHTYNRENELSAAALNRTFTVLELLKKTLNNIFFDGSHLRQWAETKIFQHCTKRQHRKNSIYLKHLAYNYCHYFPQVKSGVDSFQHKFIIWTFARRGLPIHKGSTPEIKSCIYQGQPTRLSS